MLAPMRWILLGSMGLAVAGCAGQLQWEKPGADREAAKQELRDCRRAATAEAWRISPRNVPMRYSSLSGARATGWTDPYFDRRGSDRMSDEKRITGICMRAKGYDLNPVPTELSPTSRPRST
jgi:hypothetical protein